MNPFQARAIVHIKAEIVRTRSYGKPQLYKFWTFEVQEQEEKAWTIEQPCTFIVRLNTEYGLVEGDGYRDRRVFKIGQRGRVELMRAQTYDGTIIQREEFSRLAVGVRQAVIWPG